MMCKVGLLLLVSILLIHRADSQENSSSITLNLKVVNDSPRALSAYKIVQVSGGTEDCFDKLKPGEKGTFLTQNAGKGSNFLATSNQNSTGLLALDVEGYKYNLVIYWAISNSPTQPNKIGIYWGPRAVDMTLYNDMFLNNSALGETIPNLIVYNSYDTWTPIIDLSNSWAKIRFFMSDLVNAKATVHFWEERNYLTEGYYRFYLNMSSSKVLENVNGYLAWNYDIGLSAQRFIIQRNTSVFYTIKSFDNKTQALYWPNSLTGLIGFSNLVQGSDNFLWNITLLEGDGWLISPKTSPNMFLTLDEESITLIDRNDGYARDYGVYFTTRNEAKRQLFDIEEITPQNDNIVDDENFDWLGGWKDD